MAKNPIVGFFMGHPLDCPKWAQWRLLPKEYGPGIASINVSTLGRQGVWERMFTHFSKDTDLENVSIDGSVIRAIPAAAKKKKNKKSVKPRQNSTWTF